MNLVQTTFPESQYIKEEHPKKQIYLHHTAGGPDAIKTFQHWAANSERIATCVAISDDGKIVQGFNSKYWAFHLGLKESTFQKHGVPYRSLDKISIGIEICNWGQLKKVGSKYFNYVNREVKDVIQLDSPYKGFEYFHNYTDAQIESVRELLVLWKDRYGIPLTYREDIWTINPRALKGEAGVFTHNSVRADKVDIYPHPKMIQMLKSL
jgi:N-acetyl-anhydromuramyl-L-alanine amidase AmpD